MPARAHIHRPRVERRSGADLMPDKPPPPDKTDRLLARCRSLEAENARLRRWLEIIAQSDEDDDPAGDATDALGGLEAPE